MKQKIALGVLKAGRNVFLTGSAGTGKTFLINQYITYLRERGIKPAIVAPTGIAASHIDGMTIHSFFGLGITENIDDKYIKQLFYRRFLQSRLGKLQVLIIDEVSMVSPALFISIDKILRAFKHNQKPFGGVQIILSGDFFQLPPISSSGQKIRFAWQTKLWRATDLKVCYLEEKFRQDDSTLINILDEIRAGEVSEESLEVFQECYQKKLDNKFRLTRLYTHNVDVDKINETELSKLETATETFIAETQGAKKKVEKIFNSSLVTEALNLKIGATVIFIKNNFEEGYINGTLGKVVNFIGSEKLPEVEIFSGRKIIVKPENWIVENDKGDVVATVRQMPLRLAWALTIHKSQGMTLDAAEIDLSRTFEVGQGYVALSRIRSISGLRLLGMNEVALQVDASVLKIDQRMRELSALTKKQWQSFSSVEQQEMFDIFILKIGGTLELKEIEKNKKRLAVEEKDKREFFQSNQKSSRKFSKQKLPKQKINTLTLTKELVIKKKSIEEIAKERKLSEGTIVNHLQKMVDIWPEIDLEYLQPAKKDLKIIQKIVQKIEKEKNEDNFTEDGTMRLRPIFEGLNEKFSYDEIKLILIFLDN
jgi:hypothetical protein